MVDGCINIRNQSIIEKKVIGAFESSVGFRIQGITQKIHKEFKIMQLR